MLALGALFAISMVTDPTFVGLAVIAGRDEPFVAVGVAQLIWIIVSQILLVGLAIATWRGAHERVLATFRRYWARIGPQVKVALTVFLIIAGVVLAADALAQLVNGRFLIAPDA